MKQLLIALTVALSLVAATQAIASAAQTAAPTGNLVIHITGFENADGRAKVAIVNSRENYESEGKPFMGFNYQISNNEVYETICLPYGEYAVKVFHDENGNDDLDTRIFGIPAERYGFSNNARGSFGPPPYGDVRFKLGTAEQKISIHIK